MADDVELLERYLAGDKDAFASLVERYQGQMFKLAFTYLKDADDAADIVQRAYVRAFKKAGSFRKEAQFRTWLYRITINLCKNHIRDHRRTDTLAEDGGNLASRAERCDEALISYEERQKLHQAVEGLSEKQRLVVHLRIYDELPFKDIGQIVGCSEASAKVNFHYAMKNLKRVLDEEDE